MRTRTKTGSYSVGRARREAILDVANEKFREVGYYNTAMSQIASDVGLSEGGLLHHFPSKKHLLLAVAERRFDSTAEGWDAVGNDASSPDPFSAMVVATQRIASEPGLIQLFVLMMSEAAEPGSPAYQLFFDRYDRAVESLAGLFQHHAAAGAIRQGVNYRAIAQECIAVSDGLQLQWVISNGQLDIVERIQDFTSRLRDHLKEPDRIGDSRLQRLPMKEAPIT
ncbi:TetR/AcrR family transcriptional regulator [Arthrobacter sp. 31Y]|uniref:TetR/AcrR family transcriptional regulator n=1 Tax=Arthrobacter sp. 31Y TaxID=1115632 RepID=UPI0004636C8E|nr:TetR/AcrR family transcriptional regulator [Arthrobacter sp. 31Y]